jgi:hypothetical protein
MKSLQFALLVGVVLLLSCSKSKTNSAAESLVDNSTELTTNISLESNGIKRDTSLHCIRGQAQPIVIPGILGHSQFKLNGDGITGTEKLLLSNGDSLIINNWGCEYYSLTFRFVTNKYLSDTTNIDYWLDKAVGLMKDISNGIAPPVDIMTGTDLLSQASKKEEYELGQWITYGNETMSNIVTLDRIKSNGNRYFTIEITYSAGPL